MNATHTIVTNADAWLDKARTLRHAAHSIGVDHATFWMLISMAMALERKAIADPASSLPYDARRECRAAIIAYPRHDYYIKSA